MAIDPVVTLGSQDERYVECRKCGAQNRMFVWVQLPVIPGDGTPWFDGSARPTDITDWECDACGQSEGARGEICFVGYPGITQEDKDAQVAYS